MLRWILVLFLSQQLVETSVDAVRHRVRAATLELEAAQSGEFYVAVDRPGGVMRLGLRGVVLETFPLVDVSWGQPLRSNQGSLDLSTFLSCESGDIAPPVEIVPGEPLADPVETHPPARVRLSCGSELAIVLRSESAHDLLAPIRDRLLLPGEEPTSARLRLVLSDDAYSRWLEAAPPLARWIVSP